MASITFSLHSADRLTPRHSMRFYSQSDGNCVKNPNCVICMVPVEPTFSGDLLISAVETSTPTYAPTGALATVDITVVNDTGLNLSSIVLSVTHDGNGSLALVGVPSTLANADSFSITASYTTAAELWDVTLTIYVTGTKPDTTTLTSETITQLIDITGKIPPPPP